MREKMEKMPKHSKKKIFLNYCFNYGIKAYLLYQYSLTIQSKAWGNKGKKKQHFSRPYN